MHHHNDDHDDRMLLVVAGPATVRDDWVDRCAHRSLPGAPRIDVGGAADDDAAAHRLLRQTIDHGRSADLAAPLIGNPELLAMAKARENGMPSMLVAILPPDDAAPSGGWPPAVHELIHSLPSALQQAQDWMIMVHGHPTAAVAFDGVRTVIWDPTAYGKLPLEVRRSIAAWLPLSTDGSRETDSKPRLQA